MNTDSIPELGGGHAHETRYKATRWLAWPYLCSSVFICGSFLLAASAGPSDSAAIDFNDVTKSAGLYEPLAGIMGHGGAWGDFDGDGLIDLYVGGFCDRPDSEYAPAKGPVPNRLFRNLGNGKFEEVKDTPVTF